MHKNEINKEIDRLLYQRLGYFTYLDFYADAEALQYALQILITGPSQEACYTENLVCLVCEDPDAPPDDITSEFAYKLITAKHSLKLKALLDSFAICQVSSN